MFVLAKAGIQKCPPHVCFTPEADIGTQSWNVRFVPKAHFANSFDCPIGERQKVGWNFTPYRFGRLEVEHQFERSWLLNW